MRDQLLRCYPLDPLLRRDFLRRASLGALLWSSLPGSSSGQTAPPSLLIRGGLLVTSRRQFLADIRTRAGRIDQIGVDLTWVREEERLIEAGGMLVLPGGIDPHVHLPGGADDFDSGSRTALAGGITTLGNMTFPRAGESPPAAVARVSNLIRSQALADVMLHPALREFSDTAPDQLRALFAAGHTSLKLLMVSPRWDQQAPRMPEVINMAGREGALSLIHCEDHPLVEAATESLMKSGRTSAREWARSRPVLAEVVAVQRAVALAEHTRAPIYVVHLSSERALAVCREARGRGLPVFVETRPTYLHLTEERYAGKDPGLYVANPPLRSARDVEAMWRGLTDGDIDTLGSDHSALMRAQKTDPALDLRSLRPGFSNLEVMLPMLHSEGVMGGRISLERFVEITSTAPSRLFGLFPAKGTIRVGSDADLVLWDPAQTRTVRAAELQSRCDFSPYEGRRVTGWPRMTIRRGEIVYQDGEIADQPGRGRLLRRGPTRPPGEEAEPL